MLHWRSFEYQHSTTFKKKKGGCEGIQHEMRGCDVLLRETLRTFNEEIRGVGCGVTFWF